MEQFSIRHEFQHAATSAAAGLRHQMVEPKRVRAKKLLKVFGRRCDAVDAEQFSREADIRPPPEIDFMDAIPGGKHYSKPTGQRHLCLRHRGEQACHQHQREQVEP